MRITKKQEEQLLRDLRAGRKNAVRRWFALFAPYLSRVALKKLSIKEDAEEIVQETFINCLKQLSLFRGQSRLKTWMVSILRHEIADYYRKQYAKKTLQTVPLAKLILAEPVKKSAEVSQLVKEVLASMTHERKELLLMKYVDRKKVKEIAARWQKTAKAVEAELFRAREEFRTIYLQLENQ